MSDSHALLTPFVHDGIPADFVLFDERLANRERVQPSSV
jgi:hypothetical protein